MKNFIDKLLNIVQAFLWYGIFIGLAWLITYLFQITMFGGIEIRNVFWWIVGSWFLGSIVIAIFVGIGELYIAFNKKYEEMGWNNEVPLSNKKAILLNVLVVLLGLLTAYFLVNFF